MNLNIHKVLLLSAIGFLFGSGLLLYDYQATPESIRFVKAPQFTVWLFLVCCMVSYWLPATLPLLKQVQELWRFLEGKNTEPILSAIFFLILILVGFILWLPYRIRAPLAHHGMKMIIILLGNVLLSVLMVFGIGLVNSGFNRKFEQIKADVAILSPLIGSVTGLLFSGDFK